MTKLIIIVVVLFLLIVVMRVLEEFMHGGGLRACFENGSFSFNVIVQGKQFL
jgi:hypothetical protein